MKVIDFFLHPSNVAIVFHVLIVTTITVHVIMKRPTTGVALAWLFLVTLLPFVGALIYLLIGDRRIGHARRQGIEKLRTDYQKISQSAIGEEITNIDWSSHASAACSMNRLGLKTGSFSTVQGSSFLMLSNTPEILTTIARDVDAAKKNILMEFYIWNEGSVADKVLEAVIRAAQRGVCCRLLIDALGARPWWKGKQPQRLKDAGVQLQPALPVGLFRTFVGRTDLRVHRKIVVIDNEVAWTGSMNLVDPSCFKQEAGVGQWVDAMVRVEGSVVAPLAVTMIGDWVLETGELLEDLVDNVGLHLVASKGTTDIQVVPSGPGQSEDGLLQMILALINSAQQELVLTTPYMVPDESLLRAIRGAAGRGVKVSLIVPEKVDSLLTRYASRSYYDNLLDMGVEIYQFRKGLLHTKSVMADGKMSMFGTVNLDMRSLWINYEVALFIYCRKFTKELRTLQQTYMDDSDRLNPAEWGMRSSKQRFMENTMRLVSPLL